MSEDNKTKVNITIFLSEFLGVKEIDIKDDILVQNSAWSPFYGRSSD
ncbi:hypothetical protein EYZ11_007183 [Aspergillus tanneri]|uniref:Uncharacterized protein n=1 Tax=Aspergillus tanneri TaxID=1220188 RepID=A0A4S3JFU8_9EURO|nr:hypothetical protein EYZ11_007183 [Aspergillus tanneri]